MEPKKILIVEDEASLRHALQDKLTREGYETLLAADGEEGLALALKEHPHLILLDIFMPRMDGMEMAKRLRADAWGKDAKIVLLTNVSELAQVNAAMEGRIYNYLVKSDTPLEEVVSVVRTMLGVKGVPHP